MDRLLVSTAIEESWGESEPVLFLGEWCRLFSRRHRWEGINAQVAPYHWSDREKVEADRTYLWELHERLLESLAHKLNEVQGVDHGLRYWRILIGPWLGYFTQALFDRWEQIALSTVQFEISETVVLDGLSDARCGVDMADYLGLGNSWQWNHYLTAEIIQGFTGIGCRLVDGGATESISLSDEEDPPMSIAHRAAVLGSRLSRLLARNSDVVVINSCLRSLRTELDLQRRLGQFPSLRAFQPVEPCPFDPTTRGWDLAFDPLGTSGFERCLSSFVSRFIPISYLEGYHPLVEQAENWGWPKRPRAIFTSASHFFDDVFKAGCAERVERGSPLVVGQHGGHIGMGWSFNHDHQAEISDVILSWGWEDPTEPKVRPVGMTKDLVLKRDREIPASRAVIVMGNEVTQVGALSSAALSSQFLDYMGEQMCFMESLDQTVRNALLVRLSRYDGDWCFGERLEDRFPDLELDNGKRPISDLLSEARLYIATNNGTTFLESIFLDIPTVMFWNTEMWGITELARPAFDQLSAAGVFFDNPIEAAKHVSAVWGDVGSWWASSDVREAVEAFSFEFCRQIPDVVDEVRRVLTEVGADR
ncbi:MAG: LIC12162 family protein [Acidimicrobiales bacterium]|nr:LIC12162 family protein [Acidimicrobiales bacterium]